MRRFFLEFNLKIIQIDKVFFLQSEYDRMERNLQSNGTQFLLQFIKSEILFIFFHILDQDWI